MSDFNGADPAAFDHDGDGKPGGSIPRKARAPKVDQATLNEELRKRAARQAAKEAVRMREPEIVTVRVLPLGADKISMGEHIAGIGELHYERGETFQVERSIAEALEARGFAEIQ